MTHVNNFGSYDDHVYEDIEGDTIASHGGDTTNHDVKRKFKSKGNKDHVIEDMENHVETVYEDVVSEDENILLV